MWRIRWAPNNASKWKMGFNSACKGLISPYRRCQRAHSGISLNVVCCMHPAYFTVVVCPSIPPWFAQPKNTTVKIQPVKIVITLFCQLVLRLLGVHLFASALVFQTYRIHVCPKKWETKFHTHVEVLELHTLKYVNLLTFCWPCISVYLSQYLTNLMHKICFTISFISCLYMFRAHVPKIRRSEFALHSLWYHHTYRWPSHARDGHL